MVSLRAVTLLDDPVRVSIDARLDQFTEVQQQIISVGVIAAISSLLERIQSMAQCTLIIDYQLVDISRQSG